jgi:small-conductance mechanosensitive channel
MDNLLHVVQKIHQIASHQWFSIGNTQFTFYTLIGLFAILSGAWWLANQFERTIHRLANKHKETRSGFYAIARISRYLIWIFGTLIGLDFIGFNISSLTFLGGAIGVGIGFGLQNIFSNFISGIILLVEKTLKIGDFVQVESGIMGYVREIGMRYTRITTSDLVDIIVPNSEFINGRVTNWSYDESVCRLHIPFGVAYGVDKIQVREAGIEAARSVSGTIENEVRKIDVWLVNFGDSSLDFELVVWVNPELMYAISRTKARYLWALEDELRKRHIEIPFPQRDLHIKSGWPS